MSTVLTTTLPVDVTLLLFSDCSATSVSATGQTEVIPLQSCLAPWTHYDITVRAQSSDEHHGIRSVGSVSTKQDGMSYQCAISMLLTEFSCPGPV